MIASQPQSQRTTEEQIEIAGRPAQFRAMVSNITDEDGWWASSSTLLWPVSPRTVRATFSMTFD